MQQKLLSWNLLPLVIYLRGNDLLNMSYFLKSLDGQFGPVVHRTSLKELYK